MSFDNQLGLESTQYSGICQVRLVWQMDLSADNLLNWYILKENLQESDSL